ncbi:hypothetical protein LTSEMON_5196 [Salmonella enterica subsp. enterica serovar Montevideo str. S5-403]|uniref:Uncharacterized protein n=1 Tax=Salmonella enterica subsp. enterica serovar Montevideo str. S5-403 TaxID=913242 RepID=G5Q9T4_SALMO|nr:hypothetical protein LTSEMON_5196 [Salmonella enterica subsp. enterica serovar Montevideo str. S5-403]
MYNIEASILILKPFLFSDASILKPFLFSDYFDSDNNEIKLSIIA